MQLIWNKIESKNDAETGTSSKKDFRESLAAITMTKSTIFLIF